MNKKDGGFDSKKLFFVLFVVIILGIIILVGVLIGRSFSTQEPSNNTVEQSANVTKNDIEDKLAHDPEYNIDEAIADYQKLIENGDTENKIESAGYYANYLYSVYKDLDKSVAIFERVEPLLETNSEKVYYFETLRDFYLRFGFQENANQISDLLNNMIPDEDLTFTNNEAEVSE